MAFFSQRQFSLGAPDCPMVHQTVSGAPGWRLSGEPFTGKVVALGKRLTAYGYKSPDCPVVHRTVR
jgi:hypothetical protein